MTKPHTIECDVRVRRRAKGRHELRTEVILPTINVEPGRIPRVARLTALAIRFEELVRSGQVAGYSQLARLGHVSRARISQIMNLLLLSPSIQEQVLFLPRVQTGRDPIQLRHLQPIAQEWDWRKQRHLWAGLLRQRYPGPQNPRNIEQNCLEVEYTPR
jgi:hypothetical protein